MRHCYSALLHQRNRCALVLLIICAMSPIAMGQGGLPYTISPPEGSVQFGAAVASGGDVDGDGLPDIFVADPAYVNPTGIVGRWFVFSGADGSLIWSATGDRPFTYWWGGYMIVGAFIEDLDGDGRADLIVGTPNADEARGTAYVYSGRTGELIYEYVGAQPEDRLGQDVSGLADLNGDRVSEFAILTQTRTPGSVVVYDGTSGRSLLHSPGTTNPAKRVRDGGDLDGDTIPDIVISTRQIPSGGGTTGEVLALSGRTGEMLWRIIEAGDTFGWNLTTGVDLTGDEVPDVLTRQLNGRTEFIAVISGATGRVVSTQLSLIQGIYWGSAMALADLNADGRLDLVAMGLEQGRFGVDVVNPRTRRVLHWAEGLNPRSGWFLSGNEMAVADVNGDGADDLIVGSSGSGVCVFGGGQLLLNLVSRITNYDVTRGEPHGFTVGGGLPGRTMHLLGSTSGNGCTFVPQLGICIDLDQRIYNLGAAVTDPERVAHFAVQVPLHMPLGPVWLQAVDSADPSRGPITSNVMRLEVVD